MNAKLKIAHQMLLTILCNFIFKIYTVGYKFLNCNKPTIYHSILTINNLGYKARLTREGKKKEILFMHD